MTKAFNAKELSGVLSVSQRHVWRLNAAERLPKPVRLGRCVRWLESDIREWLGMRCPSRAVFEKRQARIRQENRFHTASEDRATLGSDLSAEAGYTGRGRGLRTSPRFPSCPVAPKR
jgi:predicted DNA-binding transcriptional regulator AlpA